MPWISFDTKNRHFPWRNVSWKEYAALMRKYFGVKKRNKKPVPPIPSPAPAPKPAPAPERVLMFDDVTWTLIPKNASAVAGYVDGHFRTWAQIEKNFPHAKKVRIAVFGQDNGDALDVEPGDAAISQAAKWVKRQNASWDKSKHDVRLPVVYTAVADAQKLVESLRAAGLVQGKHWLLWTAHYDPGKGEHICNSGCGFGFKGVADGTQFTDHAKGENLDESVTRSGFWK